jgi:hypothetical protein
VSDVHISLDGKPATVTVMGNPACKAETADSTFKHWHNEMIDAVDAVGFDARIA